MIRPVVALTRVSALAIEASIALSIVLVAVATAIAIAAPTGAIDAATATDAVVAVTLEVSRADRAIAVAWMPVAPSPSIDAFTVAATRFSVVAPAPLAERP